MKRAAHLTPLVKAAAVFDGYVSFYRTITTDALKGPSAAAILKNAFHARTFYLLEFPSAYDTGLSTSMETYAARIGLRLIGAQHPVRSAPPSSDEAIVNSIMAAHPDGVYYAGTDDGGGRLVKILRQKGYKGPVFIPDGVCDSTYVGAAGSGAANSFCTVVGPDPAAAVRSFRIAYQRRFHVTAAYFQSSATAASRYDAPAYDAANIALHAIDQAATHGTLRGSLDRMRAAVLPYVAHVRWHGATGLTSFDRNGDPSNRIVNIYIVRQKKWTYWGMAPIVRGVNPTS